MRPIILVTGATGFIGRAAVEALVARGLDVHAVHSTVPRRREVGIVRWHQADLLKASDRAGLVDTVRPTHLLHLAWSMTPGRYLDSPENARWADATSDLARRFASAGGRRLVAVGSCFEYEPGVCDEVRTPARPRTPYAAAKEACRQELEGLARETGMSFAWPRVFFVYGPGEAPTRLVASVATSLLQGRPALCSHGEQVRDYLHVGDVGDALAALAPSGVEGTVNVGAGQGVRIKDLVLQIAREVGQERLVRLGARPAPADEPPIIVACVARLRDEVGWSPKFDVITGVKDTVAWWRRELARQRLPETPPAPFDIAANPKVPP